MDGEGEKISKTFTCVNIELVFDNGKCSVMTNNNSPLPNILIALNMVSVL